MKRTTTPATAQSEAPCPKVKASPKPAKKRHAKAKAKARQKQQWSGTLSVVHARAAGIDVAAGSDLWVAIPPEKERPASETVRPFSPTTAGQRAMADWLQSEGITIVALEATGIYWLPLYHLLSERGLQVIVVNPRDTKSLRKKSDIADCQWLQYLLSVGLLKASFVPPAEILAMRGVWRHRDDLVRQAAMHVQHMQKSLDEPSGAR